MESSLFTARRAVLGLVLLAGVGLLGGYGMAMRARPSTTPVTLSPAPSAEDGGGRLFVHVAGAVASGGLYELSEGARVNDAILAAGGLAPDADADALNLAATVSDGDKILVPKRGEARLGAGGGGDGQAGSGLVNLNTASASELESLPGIGPALAQRIIAFRTERGGFGAVEDLLEVSGIGPKTLEGLRDMVSV